MVRFASPNTLGHFAKLKFNAANIVMGCLGSGRATALRVGTFRASTQRPVVAKHPSPSNPWLNQSEVHHAIGARRIVVVAVYRALAEVQVAAAIDFAADALQIRTGFSNGAAEVGQLVLALVLHAELVEYYTQHLFSVPPDRIKSRRRFGASFTLIWYSDGYARAVPGLF